MRKSGDMNKPYIMHIIHLDEEMRRKEEIQLLEGAELSLPWPWLAFASIDDNIGFEVFPFPTTAGENEVDGICVLLNTCENK